MPERATRRLTKAAFAAAALVLLVQPVRAQSALSLPRADGSSVFVSVYEPTGPSACPPAAIVSHGFGGDEKQLDGLSRRLAEAGWRFLSIRHAESGRDALKKVVFSGLAAIDQAARAAPLHAARFADLDAAYREAVRPCRPFPLLLIGHSMGAQTTMMEAGAVARIGAAGGDRFDAYVALSPQGVGTAYAAGAWQKVRKPVLMITGTRDKVVEGDYTARLTAFDGLPPGNKRLAVIPGAGHLEIGGIGRASVRRLVDELVLEFANEARERRFLPSRVSGAEIRDK